MISEVCIPWTAVVAAGQQMSDCRSDPRSAGRPRRRPAFKVVHDDSLNNGSKSSIQETRVVTALPGESSAASALRIAALCVMHTNRSPIADRRSPIAYPRPVIAISLTPIHVSVIREFRVADRTEPIAFVWI